MTDQPDARPVRWAFVALAIFAVVGVSVGLWVWWLGHGVPVALVAGMLTYCGLVLAPVPLLLASVVGLLAAMVLGVLWVEAIAFLAAVRR